MRAPEPQPADRSAGPDEPGQQSDGPPQEARPRARHYRLALNMLAVGGLIAALLYLHTRVVRVAYIPTGSMTPTLRPGDRVLVSLAAYRKHSPQRGDVVAFWDPESHEHQVKRVVAVGGDTISIHWGAVFLNGEVLDEPYLAQPMLLETPLIRDIGPGQLFVMGDNRNASEDSRDSGPIGEEAVLGRVFFRILPLRSAGSVR